MERVVCVCCGCHTMPSPQTDDDCVLCKWGPHTAYPLEHARANVAQYGIVYPASDVRFAIVRHPILGPAGEYAIDRVALRARAYIEFRLFGKDKPPRAAITVRLQALLDALRAADSLYTK